MLAPHLLAVPAIVAVFPAYQPAEMPSTGVVTERLTRLQGELALTALNLALSGFQPQEVTSMRAALAQSADAAALPLWQELENRNANRLKAVGKVLAGGLIPN